ncbi:serine/threonine-protein kinase PknD [Rubritalea halochordaticola]|uniref:Serine/threonine-protein kinase PknD n=1 Tax=Rubritalea halochordaticola TaxID=714537 RepID=A0ABP9V5L3_9BACT
MSTRHQIIEQLGSGGFGTVYRAKDTQLNREIAIKRLKATEGSNRSELMSTLLEEAKILAALRHPNIVTIYDIQSTDEHAEIIMELVKGITVEQLIKRHLLLARDFSFIATQILSALSVAHKHSVLHCDLKPSNLMLCATQGDNYEVKIVDFGMSPSASNITGQTTKIIGSIYFMAPEQLDKGEVSVQTDVYSLGCLFYYMLTGAHPFDGDTTVQVMASHMLGNYKPITTIRKDLPHELCDWVEKHISKNPEDRFQSCKDALNALIKLNVECPTEAFKLEASSKSKRASLDVRPITTSSLAPEESKKAKTGNEKDSEFVLPPHAAQLAEKHQKAEFNEVKKPLPSAPKEPKALAEQVIRIAPNSIWYFTIKGQRRGPIPIESLGGLIENGQLREEDSVWHPAYDDWRKVKDCEELKPYLDKVKEANKPDTVSLLSRLFKNKSKPETSDQPSSGILSSCASIVSIELLIIFFGTLVCGAYIWYKPDLWQFGTAVFGITLFCFGYFKLKLAEGRTDLLWLIAGISLPVFGDLLYTLTHLKMGAKSFLLMLLGMSLLLYIAIQSDLFHMISISTS